MNEHFNHEAEAHLISSAILDPSVLDDAPACLVQPEHLHHKHHQIVWAAIRELHTEGETPTLVSVTEKLRTTPAPNWSRGDTSALATVTPARLLALADNGTSAMFANQSANAVLTNARLREIQRVLRDATTQLQQAGASPDNVLEFLSRNTTALMQVDRGRADTDVLEEVLAVLDPEGSAYLRTGYRDLDRQIGGLPVGVTIIAGRPSMGKTSLARGIMRNACNEGKKVALFSMDQSKASIYKLEASTRARVPLTAIRNEVAHRREGGQPGRYATDEQISAWRTGAGQVAQFYPNQFAIDDYPYLLDELLTRIREAVRWGADLVAVDYLQQVQVRGVSADNNTARVTAVSLALKNIAMECRIPIIGVAQLSRAVEQRQNKRPLLSDLRESGGIEQDAHVVLMLYRDAYYDARERGVNEPDVGVAEVIVGKSKEGAVGTQMLQWHGPLTTFRDLSGRDAPMPEAYR